MSVERKLTLPGYFPPEQLASAVRDVIGKEVNVTSRNLNVPGTDLFFDLKFMEPGRRRMERQIRGHHGHPTDDGEFPGQSHTYLVTGSFGCTDEILMALGRRFGGVYFDEDDERRVSFADDAAPAPTP